MSYLTNRTDDDSNRIFTPTTVTQVIKFLTLASKYNQHIAITQLNYNVIKQLEVFLPDPQAQTNESQTQAYLSSTISLIDTLIPLKPQTLEELESVPEQVLCESDKRDAFTEGSHIASSAEHVLPRLFKAYEETVSRSIRQHSLQVIDKVISLMDNTMLDNFIVAYDFAKFLYGIFKQKELAQTTVCCQIV